LRVILAYQAAMMPSIGKPLYAFVVVIVHLP
jgi:hypothetical protein